MLTQRDKQILKFIESYGGITINQCAKVFFKDAKHGYDLARKRMRKILEMTELHYFTNKLTGERVYCEQKKLTPHAIYILDILATFIYNGATIIEFRKEPQWLEGKYRSDAFILFEYNNITRIACLEVDVTHTTDMAKYEDLYRSNIFQEYYGVFPLIIVVGDILTEYNNTDIDTVFIDYTLNGFAEKILTI